MNADEIAFIMMMAAGTREVCEVCCERSRT